MDNWQEIIKTALVGTQRKSLQIPAENTAVKELDELDKILLQANKNSNDKDIEGNLLSSAGVTSLYRKAGKFPKKGLPLDIKPSQPEDYPECELKTAQYLSIILADKNATLLPEWLYLAASKQKRIPAKYLPELLWLGKRKRELRDRILNLVGNRGRWLASQNPSWSYAVEEDEETTWKKGSPGGKRELFQKLRKKDAKEALKTLEKYWKKQKVEDKTALLEALKINLSMDDEEFLGTVLEDKRKQVRDIAGELLASLPESRLVERMIQRASSLISINSQTQKIEITLPTKCTREMNRDGIDQSKYKSGLGEKACLLLQILSCIPPKYWSDTYSKTPEELIQIISGNKWEKLFLEAWVSATIKNQDKEWSAVLLKHVTEKLDKGYLKNIEQMLRELLEILDSSQAQKLIMQVISTNKDEVINKNSPIYKILNATNFYWESELSNYVLSQITESIKNYGEKYNLDLEKLMKHCGIYMEPNLVDKAIESLTPLQENTSYWNRVIDDFLSRLKLRKKMIEAFN